MSDVSPWIGLLLAAAALVAGFVDAVVGGGGLVQLPALALAFPGAAPIQLLAANKLAGTCGTTVSALTYRRRLRPDPRVFVPLMAVAFAGSAIGALSASHLSRRAFDPLIVVALVVVGGFVALRPDLGRLDRSQFGGPRRSAAVLGSAFAIGIYDGALGPGTGTFLVVVFVTVAGYAFLEASALARLANWSTNVAALLVFVGEGAVPWRLGLLLGSCNLIGSYVGARTAVARGSSFVRVLLLIVVAGFAMRIALDVILGSR